jgi:predicted Zn-dependent protease with MMP-like domain
MHMAVDATWGDGPPLRIDLLRRTLQAKAQRNDTTVADADVAQETVRSRHHVGIADDQIQSLHVVYSVRSGRAKPWRSLRAW